MAVVSPPVFTDSVNQQFFIESQGGAQHPISYLDRFPETLYSKSIDSVLVTFLYALLGPVGVGQLRQAYLEARLQFEEAGLSTANLDSLYTSPFAFARLADETYEIDANASLLKAQDRSTILNSDAVFRNRAITFFKGIRAGGTLQGLSLIAQSGLNHPVELVENYRWLYDQFSDVPLNIPHLGTTNNLSEVVVIPRKDVPQNAVQTLVINGEPTSGWFTLTMPLGAPYQVIPVTLTNGSNTITVPNAANFPNGVYVSITNVASTSPVGSATPTVYAQADIAISPTKVNLVYPPTSVNAGQPYVMSSSGAVWAYVGNAETIPLPYNASAIKVRNALLALPLIGSNDVVTAGGPLPDQPITIQFVNAMGDRPIPALLPNLAPSTPPINGITGPSTSVPQMTDVTNNPLTITASVTVDVAGASADSQTSAIAPADEHAMQTALDQVRPLTSFFTTQPSTSVTQRLASNTIYSGDTYTEVLRYETGNASVIWPQTDSVHWLQSGKEREAPRPAGDLQHQYQGFHNVANAIAYSEAALSDPNYQNPTNPLWVTYWDTHMGPFSQTQVLLYPFLQQFNDLNNQFTPPSLAVAVSADPLVITDTVNGTGVINGMYPVDYLGLPGVPQLPTGQSFWASSERAPATSGAPSIDFLEIDLGSVQAVNYVYFEATNKPYQISVAYDVLDQAPSRAFVPVTLMPSAIAPSVTNLTYNATNTNPWSVVEIHCTNALQQMLYTRYIRIGFQRTPANTPFLPAQGAPLPYSIEVRNLRIGRNVSASLARSLSSQNVLLSGLYPSSSSYPSSSLLPA